MRKRVLACVLSAATAGCGLTIKLPDCMLNGSCLPTPAPSASPSPSPCPPGQHWYEHGGPHQTSGCVPDLPPPSPSPTPAPSPSPEPPSPSPSPSPMPSPSPSPSPSPAPSAPPDPHADDELADDLKIGANTPVDKRPGGGRGFRNTFNVSPTIKGKTIGPESGLGLALIERYGEIRGMIIMPNGARHGFEHQGCSLADFDPADKCKADDFYLFVDATNSAPESEWAGDVYLAAGPRTYCVTWDHLDHWRCLPCAVNREGKVVDRGNVEPKCGSNAQAFDLPK